MPARNSLISLWVNKKCTWMLKSRCWVNASEWIILDVFFGRMSKKQRLNWTVTHFYRSTIPSYENRENFWNAHGKNIVKTSLFLFCITHIIHRSDILSLIYALAKKMSNSYLIYLKESPKLRKISTFSGSSLAQ